MPRPARSQAPQTTARSLRLTRSGYLVALAAGERLSARVSWYAQTGQAGLGRRLLELAATGDAPLAEDLAWGRELARAVLRARASGSAEDPQAPAPAGPLAELRARAPGGLAQITERLLGRAWGDVALEVDRALTRPSLDRDAFFCDNGIDVEIDRVHFHLAEQADDLERPFAFFATHSRPRGEHGRPMHVPLAEALAERVDDVPAQERLLAPIRRAAARVPRIAQLLESHELFHAVAWTAEEARALLVATPELIACGIRVRVPDWWHKERPQPQLRAQIGEDAPSQLGLGALLDFQLRYFIGDDELTADEWQQLTRGAAGLHYLRGKWIDYDPARHADALAHWEAIEAAAARGEVGFVEGMRLLAGLPRASLDEEPPPPAWTVAEPGPWLARTLAELQSPAGCADADPGEDLRGELRPYQREGVAWLWLLTRLGIGGCLADDMGLGKTIQVIALLLLLRRHGERGPHLVVLPASLLANWRAEIERFGPALRVHVAHRSMSDVDHAPDLGEVDVVLTTYATLLRQAWIQEAEWGLVALDEAQAIKNPIAKQTRATKALRSRHRLILTGTPVENALVDLWSLFDFSSPGLLGGVTDFKTFSRRLGSDAEGLAPLRQLVRPYILRRLKTDRRVIADLPDKTEIPVYCGLTRAQAALYARAVDALAREVAAADGIRRRGIILAYLTRFKQICNHPSHYSGDGVYAEKASAKFQRLRELAEAIAEAGEKAIVFTQFREITGPLAELLARAFGRPGLVLHGGTAVGKRPDLVAAFQREDGPPFMVLSLKAGGTGLNLTAAAHVIHFDRWWNPAVENQATDRAYRIGQHKNVLVHKFVCRGTLEEKIDAMIRDKQGLAEGVLGGDGERRLTELDTDELMSVVSLDLRAALGEE